MRKELFVETFVDTSQTTRTNLLTEEKQIGILSLVFFLGHLLGNELLMGQLENCKQGILLSPLSLSYTTECYVVYILCRGESKGCKDTE
jgi:hypothetical protein